MLNLENCNFGMIGFNKIFKVIKDNLIIRSLKLSENKLFPRCINYLRDNLKYTVSLKNLILKRC